MAKGVKTEDWKELFIINNAEKYTAEEFADHLKISKVKVYVFCKKNNISPRSPSLAEKHLKRSLNRKGMNYIKANKVQPSKPSFTRPPAQYSNASPFGIATELHNSSK